MHGRIGVAIGGPTTDDALHAFETLAGRAGFVELRLDLFVESADVTRLIEARPCPIVVTCRAAIEGGKFNGTETERLDLLRHAAAHGAEYIDVEQFAFSTLGNIAPARGIVSNHDFSSMPVDLDARAAMILEMGADVVKVAGMASDPIDIVPVLDVLAHAKVPTIAMAMGPAGVASRVLSLRYPQCLLTYASINELAGTAPGQISLSTMEQVYHAGSIDESTRFFGLIAPASDAELIAEYNHRLAETGINAVCVPLPTNRPAGPLMLELIRHGFSGFHIHGPSQTSLTSDIDMQVLSTPGKGSINSVTVYESRLSGSYVENPRDQIDRWTAGS
ncbi:MAG: type I 3-dehydroquinate dehydratase [Chloroflexota bacterium]